MDWVLQKGTEVGISRFVPMITARTVVRRYEKRARWERILVEATEQSGRARVPELGDIREFSQVIPELSQYHEIFLAHVGEEIPRLRDVIRTRQEPPERVALLIGPEGGFTLEEVERAQAHSATIVHLGPRTLRSETAGVVIASIVLHYWGDLA